MPLVKIDWNPRKTQLRSFGWIALGALAALAAWAAFRASILGISLSPEAARICALTLGGVALLCGLLALLAPAALRPLYLLLTVVSYPIGFVLSYVVLGLFFYGILTPIGLLFRIIGRDSMARRFEPGADSYWIPRQAAGDAKRYYRQF